MLLFVQQYFAMAGDMVSLTAYLVEPPIKEIVESCSCSMRVHKLCSLKATIQVWVWHAARAAVQVMSQKEERMAGSD